MTTNPPGRFLSKDKRLDHACNRLIMLHRSGPQLCLKTSILLQSERQRYPDLVNFIINYTRENIAYTKFYIKEPFYTKSLRDVPISRMSFIGNAGGLISLCIGLSFISFVEIIFHLSAIIYSSVLTMKIKEKSSKYASSELEAVFVTSASQL